MSMEPIKVFARIADPALVARTLRELAPQVELDASDDEWRSAKIATGSGDAKRTLIFTHDPAYYSEPGWSVQMGGMRGYFSRFADTDRKPLALALTTSFRFALGTLFEPDIDPAGDERLTILFAIAEALDGVLFTPSSLRDAKGRVLFGAGGKEEEAPDAVWPKVLAVVALESAPLGGVIPRDSEANQAATAIRAKVFAELEGLGFRPAGSLPLPDLNVLLRPAAEIAARLMSLHALLYWVTFPEDVDDADGLEPYIKENHLRDWLTPSEREIIDLSRNKAHEEHVDTIGWKLENMWGLAWVLGFEPEPALEAAQIEGHVTNSLLSEFLPGFDGTVADLLAETKIRPLDEVIAMEYRFYCAHNAVRSAQIGRKTVPDGFHPVVHGGGIHERRHALSWCLAPGVPWDETDLST